MYKEKILLRKVLTHCHSLPRDVVIIPEGVQELQKYGTEGHG